MNCSFFFLHVFDIAKIIQFEIAQQEINSRTLKSIRKNVKEFDWKWNCININYSPILLYIDTISTLYLCSMLNLCAFGTSFVHFPFAHCMNWCESVSFVAYVSVIILESMLFTVYILLFELMPNRMTRVLKCHNSNHILRIQQYSIREKWSTW